MRLLCYLLNFDAQVLDSGLASVEDLARNPIQNL